MAVLPDIVDPTLLAVDQALEAVQEARPRPYLGMSEVGHACARHVWYRFHWTQTARLDAAALRRIDDGHRGEKVIADRLALVRDIILHNNDNVPLADFGNHFRGHVDGIIKGLVQAPKTVHVWECKVVGDDRFRKLKKLRRELGEKQALKAWDTVYYVQACLYMYYAKLTRHYLTVATPGCRDAIGIRTEADLATAEQYRSVAHDIIFSPIPPRKVSQDPDFFVCKMCRFRDICHFGAMPERHCRTCRHSTARPEGTWACLHHEKNLTLEEQRIGCDDWANGVN